MWTYPHLNPAQKTGILGHSLSGPVDWTNSREEFEGDLLSIDLDPDVESAGKPHAGRFESRSAKPSAFFTSAMVHVAFFWALVFYSCIPSCGDVRLRRQRVVGNNSVS